MGLPVEGGDVPHTRAVQNRGVFAGLLMEEKVKMSFPTNCCSTPMAEHHTAAAAAASQDRLDATQDSTHRYSCASS